MRRVLGYVHLETFKPLRRTWRLLQLIDYSIFQMMAMLQVTPLMAACYAGNSKAAALLLSKGADPNKATKEIIEIEFDELLHPILNATILSWAASNGYFEAVITPLYSAAESGYTDIVRSLLEGGADPNMGLRSTDEHGGVDVRTPMNVAAERGYTEVVISLLEGGARQDLDTGGGELG